MGKRIAGAFCIVMLLGGCAMPPRVADSKLLAPAESRADQLVVVYRDVQLRTVSSYRFGSSLGRTTPAADTGIREFGKIVVDEAAAVFAGRQMTVQKAVLLDDSQPLPSDAAAPMLVLAPKEGRTQSSTMSTVASYSFAVQLLDPVRRRLLWQGTLDTNAWVGQDFVMKNFEKKTYDAAQARNLLQAVAEKLSEDGLIR